MIAKAFSVLFKRVVVWEFVIFDWVSFVLFIMTCCVILLRYFGTK